MKTQKKITKKKLFAVEIKIKISTLYDNHFPSVCVIYKNLFIKFLSKDESFEEFIICVIPRLIHF